MELEVTAQLGGAVTAAAYGEGRLLVGVGPRVVEFETSPPFRQVASSPSLAGVVTGLATGDGFAVATLGADGLVVLEDDTDGLTIAGSLALPQPAGRVAISGTRAFVAAGAGGLRIVDVGDRKRPVEVGAIFTLHVIRDVDVEAGHAFVAAADEGLLIADVRADDQPRAVGSLFTSGFATGVEAAGGRVYLADGLSGLRVIDAADPSQPRLLGTLPTVGWAMDAAAADDVVFVAAGSRGLVSVDVANPSEPKLRAVVPLAQLHADEIVIGAGIAFIVDPSDGLQIVDVRLAEPRPLGTWQPLIEASAIALADQRAIIAAGSAGLRVVDLSVPAQPFEVSGLSAAAPVQAVALVDDRALFVTDWDPGAVEVPSLFAVDLSGPEPAPLGQPTLLSGHLGNATFPIDESALQGEERTFVAGPAWSATVAGDVVAFAIELGVVLVDASATPPCELAFLQTNPRGPELTANSVAIRGDLAYVGIDPGTYVIDISDPRKPRLVRKVADLGAGPGLVNGDWLYVVEGQTLVVVDLRTADRPTVAATLALPGEAPHGPIQKQVAMAGGWLFLSLGESGVVAIDVSEASRPRIAGRIEVPGTALGIASDGVHLYVGSTEAGLLVVNWRARDGAGPEPSSAVLGPGPGASGESWSGIVETFDRPAPAVAASRDPDAEPKSNGCMVTSTEDEGPGTLRECLDTIQPGEAIAFEPGRFSMDAPGIIELQSPLMFMTPGIVVDGRGGVVLNGGGHVESAFDPGAAHVTLRGLHIRNFNFGVLLSQSGNGAVLEGNVISGNREDLYMGSAHGCRIVGNLIGVDASGTRLVHHPDTVFHNVNMGTGSSMNRIEGNLFGSSLFVDDKGSSDNVFVGNRFGVDPEGRELCACGLHVLQPFNQVGGPGPDEGNDVRGHVTVNGRSVVIGNAIGSAAPVDAPDESPSVLVIGHGNIVGGRSPHGSNRVVGRWPVELAPNANRNLVLGNRVGADGLAVKAQRFGIRVFGFDNAIVANEITVDTRLGIQLARGSRGNVVAGNVLEPGTGAVDEGAGNLWDFDGAGNFWSDHTDPDRNGDGLVDVARDVPPNGRDRFPLAAAPYPEDG